MMKGLGFWGDYLSCGFRSERFLSQKLSELTSSHLSRVQLVNHLQSQGWALVHIDSTTVSSEERKALATWQQTLQAAFQMKDEDKSSDGGFRMENDITIGYKKEGVREFFETRELLGVEGFRPDFPQVKEYSKTVEVLFKVLKRVGSLILTAIAHRLGLDPAALLSLTDLVAAAPRSTTAPKPTTPSSSEEVYSSSILRISNYPPHPVVDSTSTDVADKDMGKSTGKGPGKGPGKARMAFGAHTDSCFITIGLCAAAEGLEILDLMTGEWINVEKGQPSNAALVFVGDFLQVFSKGRFQATPHRVRSPPAASSSAASVSVQPPQPPPIQIQHTEPDESSTGSISTVTVTVAAAETTATETTETVTAEIAPSGAGTVTAAAGSARVSCPFLIRGRHNAVINLQDTSTYTHRIPEAVADPSLFPDLDGTRMKTVHRMLDLKRRKCANSHAAEEEDDDDDSDDSDDDDWVLSAFPVQVIERKNKQLLAQS